MTYVKLLILFLKVVLIIGFVAGAFAIYSFIKYKHQGIDLAQSESWLNFPGATITNKGIHFQSLNRTIIHQDGSVAQPNPPVNISSQYLFKGDFKITAVLSAIDKQASFRLYFAPPIVYDQWRFETPSIEVNVDVVNNLLIVRIWDGSSSSSMDIRTYEVSLSPQIVISLEHINSQINIIENDHTLGSMPDHNIFDGGSIWFGVDGVYGSGGWTLSELYVQALGNGNVEIMPVPLFEAYQNNPNSLRNLAQTHHRKLKIGSAVNVNLLFTDEQYRNLALGQFNMLTSENSMKPQFIHPQPNVYDFSEADQLLEVALKNDIEVHGHTLVYDKSSPDWMTKGPKEERKNIMVSHIENVVSHFKGKVIAWDVVNEPFSKKHTLYGFGKSGLEPNIWFEAMGEKYIDLAFETAHKADPSAKLYLNDYGVEKDGQRWDALLSLVKRLKKRGVPIDGVGFEAHIYTDGDYIDAKQLRNHMEILNNLGLLTRISEIDVTQDDAKEQISQYVTALDVCLRAPNCTSYTTWGITDKYGSTTRSDRYPLVYGTSLLWDKDMKAKPAYDALQNRLKQAY